MECNPDPRAPHGFLRDASHNADRYVCECEHWTPPPYWVGCGDCDCIFGCYNGEARCIRLDPNVGKL